MELSKKSKHYFDIASQYAAKSDHAYSIGAVVVYKHRIISYGHNSASNIDAIQAYLDMATYGCYCPGKLHAESDALKYFVKRHINLSGAELYVYRAMKSGGHGMARPCKNCMKLIKQCGIKKIYYTTPNGYAKEVLTEEE